MPEATAGLSSGSRGASAGLPGRFSDNGSYKGAMSGTGPANRRFIREARLSDKLREISVRTHSEAGIPRVSNRHCGNEVFLARNENTQNSESGREISLRANFGKTTSQFSGPVAGYPSSYNNCTIVFSKSPERPFQGSKFLRRKSKLPDSGCAFLGVKRGVDVVEKLASFPQREEYSGSKRAGNNFLGCLKERMGSSFGPIRNRRTLVLGGANPAHKYSRTSSGLFSNKSLATQNRQATCSVCNRQPNCSNIHKQIRWNPLTATFTLSNRTMAFCSENEPNSVSSLCAGNKKLHSRQEVKSVQRLTRVDAKSQGVSTDFTQNAWVRSRSVCLQNKSPIDSFCQLETRARCDGMRCFQFELGSHERLPFPTFLPDPSLHKNDSARSGRMHLDHTSLEEQAMVPSDSISPGRQSAAVTKGQQTAAIARNRQGASSVQSKEFSLGCMASFRKEVSKQGFSEDVSKILQASWRQKTTCQYESAWKTWSSWCDQRQVDPFTTSLNVILEFLAELLHKGYKYRTIGVYRSAISNFHQPIDGIVIGKHPLMSKFIKGVYSMCPPEPKYFVTSDVNQVLSFFKTWAPAEKLTLKQLTLKLVTLAAITSAARSSSVHKMDLHSRQFKSNGVLFKIPELTKCSGPKRPLEELFLVSFPPDRRLCFVKYLKRYEKVTERLRNNSNYNSSRLFLSYIKPHRPVSSSTIA